MRVETGLKTQFVAALARRVCGETPRIVDRENVVILRRPVEEGRELDRLILLPPRGYTSNTPNQTNSYAEVERATIAIKGAVCPGKQSYSKLKDCLLVVSFNDAAKVSDLDRPYLTFDLERLEPGFTTAVHASGGPPFHVVKADGTGVYHSLLNQTYDWLVLHLHKVLRPMRDVELAPHLARVPEAVAEVLVRFYRGVVEHGDRLFQADPEQVDRLAILPVVQSIPALLEMLHVRDTGNHEA